MAMGKRKSQQQQPLFVAAADLAQSAAHPFYAKLNEVLAGWKFDAFVEGLCTSSTPRRSAIRRWRRANISACC